MATNNRSVPADTVLPHVTYQNLEEAIGWRSRIWPVTHWLFSRHAKDRSPEEWGQW
jgi:hypothetical protein